MSTTAGKDNPALWDSVKQVITAGTKGGKAGQWSARKAQLASHEYQKRGGGYVGAKRQDNHLQEWTNEHQQPPKVAEKAAKACKAAVTDLDKPALLALARQHSIRGRSRMRKDELIAALREQGRH